MRARKHDARLELQGLRFRLRELGNAAFPGAVEPRFAANFLIDLAVARLLLIEAIAQPVLRFPGDEARDDVDVGALRVAHLQPVALLDGPAVAGSRPTRSPSCREHRRHPNRYGRCPRTSRRAHDAARSRLPQPAPRRPRLRQATTRRTRGSSRHLFIDPNSRTVIAGPIIAPPACRLYAEIAPTPQMPDSVSGRPCRRQIEPDMQLLQPLGRDRRRGVHQEVLRLLVHRKGDDLAQDSACLPAASRCGRCRAPSRHAAAPRI